MRHIPKMIFAAGVAMLAYAFYLNIAFGEGWTGTMAQNSMTNMAIGVLVAAGVAHVLFVRPRE